jgi:hypothetical protein
VAAKLRIRGYSDEFLRDFQKEFSLQVNPEKITRTVGAEYEEFDAISAAGEVQAFAGIAGSELHLEFYLDSTGVIPGVTSVPDAITALKATTHRFVGKIHSPYFLWVVWGDLEFPCRLKKLTIDYTLFNPQGVPLRAKLTADFIGHVPPTKLAAEAATSSPDLTHTRVVRAGETLPLLCEQIYREDRVYPQLARHNDLDNLIALRPGMRISLPPLRD